MKGALERAWCIDTCYPGDRDRYLMSHPSTGQCAVTALLLQDIFGGDIGRDKYHDHYFNILHINHNQEWMDATRAQFNKEDYIMCDEIVDREKLLDNRDTMERYYLLRQKFNLYLFEI